MVDLVTVVAAANPPAPSGGVGDYLLKNWLQTTVLGLILLFVGLGAVARSHAGKHDKILVTAFCVLVGLFIIGLGTGTNATDVGTSLVALVRSAIPSTAVIRLAVR